MMKHEFEALALRGNAHISSALYDTIERYYTSLSRYHEVYGGLNESKQEFVKRVFGGKINTPKTVLDKIIKEAQFENRWCLYGTSVSSSELYHMDCVIADQLTWEAEQD